MGGCWHPRFDERFPASSSSAVRIPPIACRGGQGFSQCWKATRRTVVAPIFTLERSLIQTIGTPSHELRILSPLHPPKKRKATLLTWILPHSTSPPFPPSPSLQANTSGLLKLRVADRTANTVLFLPLSLSSLLVLSFHGRAIATISVAGYPAKI